MTGITGDHYGVAVEASERNGWGQWRRADEQGVGMDRSVETGTGFIVNRWLGCLNRLRLVPTTCCYFFHHVLYTYRLHSGATAIQFLYDSHYGGAAAAERYVPAWESLQSHVDDQRYGELLAQLQYQAGQAQLWSDAN